LLLVCGEITTQLVALSLLCGTDLSFQLTLRLPPWAADGPESLFSVIFAVVAADVFLRCGAGREGVGLEGVFLRWDARAGGGRG
jgi:hypothetical protein